MLVDAQLLSWAVQVPDIGDHDTPLDGRGPEEDGPWPSWMVPQGLEPLGNDPVEEVDRIFVNSSGHEEGQNGSQVVGGCRIVK